MGTCHRNGIAASSGCRTSGVPPWFYQEQASTHLKRNPDDRWKGHDDHPNDPDNQKDERKSSPIKSILLSQMRHTFRESLTKYGLCKQIELQSVSGGRMKLRRHPLQRGRNFRNEPAASSRDQSKTVESGGMIVHRPPWRPTGPPVSSFVSIGTTTEATLLMSVQAFLLLRRDCRQATWFAGATTAPSSSETGPRYRGGYGNRHNGNDTLTLVPGNVGGSLMNLNDGRAGHSVYPPGIHIRPTTPTYQTSMQIGWPRLGLLWSRLARFSTDWIVAVAGG
jgi:hypothetical protein